MSPRTVKLHISIRHATVMGLTFWDWDLTVDRGFGPHLESEGRSNRYEGARDAVTRELDAHYKEALSV